MSKVMNESLGFNDKLGSVPFPDMPIFKTNTKTRIMIGHGFQEFNGISSLKEVCFDGSNMIPIGACQFIFEQLANVQTNGASGTLNVPTVYASCSSATAVNSIGENVRIGYKDRAYSDWTNPSGAGYSAEPEASYSFTEPSATSKQDVTVTAPHQLGETLCLFGIGLTGEGENTVTRPVVNYLESTMFDTTAKENGLALPATMIPFRYTSSLLSDTDRWKYFGRTGEPDSSSETPVGYYLKRFEQQPVIRHVWKADELDVEENIDLVSQSEYYPRTETTKNGEIETYLEMKLKITSRDVKEWFAAKGNIDSTRINTIALFTGRYHPNLLHNGNPGDYENVRLFSKLTIPVENLSLTKDFDIIYRIYSA